MSRIRREKREARVSPEEEEEDKEEDDDDDDERQRQKKMMWRGGGGGGGAFLRAPQPPKHSSFGRGVGQNHHRFDDSWSSSSLKKRRARGGGGVGGFKGGRMKSAGDGIDGVSTDEEKVVVRFWHHFGSSRKCAEKRAAKGTPHLKKEEDNNNVFRNPNELENRVRRLHKYLGRTTVDLPMTAANCPEILEVDAETVVKRLMFLFQAVPAFNGSKVSKHAALLVLEKEEVERRVNAVVALEEKKWVGGGVDKEYAKECAKERMGRNPSVLLLDSVTAQCNLEEKTVTHR